MRVGVFPETLGRQAGGPESYERELLRQLFRAAPDVDFRAYLLSDAARDALGALPANAQARVLRPRSRWLSVPVSLPWAAARDRVDLLHATFVPPPALSRPLVFTMHDVSMFEHPEFYPPAIRLRLVALLRRGLASARVVLCVSEHTRRTVAERFGLPETRLAVAHHGVDARFRPQEPEAARACVAEGLGVESPYLLHVGKYEERKNLPRLIAAFARFREKTGDDTRLVLAGKPSWVAKSVTRAIARHGVGEFVVELGHVPEETLPALYSGARAFVFPSLWEGFGMPVLEAMASGTPVLTSDRTSLPEVAGDAAVLVDPESHDALVDALVRICSDDDLRGRLRARGLERAATFTWEGCARQTLRAYEQALG